MMLDKDPSTWNWNKLYQVIADLTSRLKNPGEDLKSYNEIIDETRKVETYTVIIYTKVSKHLAVARRRVSDYKFELQIKLKQLMTNNGFFKYKPIKDRKQYAELTLVEEHKNLENALNDLNAIAVYLECVNKVLGNCKHHREDLSKRIRVKEIEHGILEQ